MVLAPLNLLELGADGVEGVLVNSDPVSLGRLATTCKFFKAATADAAFVALLAAARGFSSTAASASCSGEHGSSVRGRQAAAEFNLASSVADSIEGIAVLEKMRSIDTNHIIFHLGSLSMTVPSKKLLLEYAALMRCHPRLQMRIESHTGVGAPPRIAPQHSVERACVVSRFLHRHGVPVERLRATGWGMDVGIARDWPAAREFARAECFVSGTGQQCSPVLRNCRIPCHPSTMLPLAPTFTPPCMIPIAPAGVLGTAGRSHWRKADGGSGGGLPNGPVSAVVAELLRGRCSARRIDRAGQAVRPKQRPALVGGRHVD